MPNDPVVFKVHTEDSTEPPSKPVGGMVRAASWVWDWNTTSPASSQGDSLHGGKKFESSNAGSPAGTRNSSAHGGKLFHNASPNNSAHGGNLFGGLKMKRNVSFNNLPDDAPERTSRNASAHGGNLFAPQPAGGMRRNGSEIWDWKASTPPESRDPSAHGGNAWSNPAENAPKEGFTEGMKRSMSFIWDWGKYRDEPPKTPAASRNASQHGGNAFAPPPEPSLEPAIQPPKAMTKNFSIGSFMWDWGQSRVSPPSTPGNSLHGGQQFVPEDKS